MTTSVVIIFQQVAICVKGNDLTKLAVMKRFKCLAALSDHSWCK